MLEKFLKEREGSLLRAGNITLFVAFILSFTWFIVFSFQVINQAIISNGLNPAEENKFHLDAFEEIKIIFERKGIGFAVLQKEKSANQTINEKESSPEAQEDQKKIKRNE